MALEHGYQRAVRDPPQPHLPGGRSRYQQRAVAAQRDRAREIERLGQHRGGEMGAGQAGILRFDPGQVGLPNRKA